MKTAAPSMTDIARRARVSKNTVSLALRHDPQIPAATRARIRNIAARLGYRKNPVVAHLMVQLRLNRSGRSQPTLGLINANLDPRAFTRHPTVPVYVEGCRRRAAQQGYQLDEFWLHDPALDGARLNRILHTRGIRGLVVVGLMDEPRLPARFAATWEEFPTVVTGVRTHEPALSFASADHHMLALRAVEQALALGYRRPGLALDGRIDELVDGRFTAGFRIALRRLPATDHVRPFYFTVSGTACPPGFRMWLKRESPDVVLTLYRAVRGWIRDTGRRVPEDIALIQLELRRQREGWAGMEQHNDLIGEAAIDMVVGMIHTGQKGVPQFPHATLIGSSWSDGETCPRKLTISSRTVKI